jgi:hypothetical protein
MRLIGGELLIAGGLLIAALVAAVSGCDRAATLRPGWAIVSGTVMYQDKPLPGGEVMWCTDKDGIAVIRGGPIREDGSFSLDAPIGPAKVAIHNADVKKTQPSRYVEIPAKYTDVERSGLIYEAKAGENKDVKFNLQ